MESCDRPKGSVSRLGRTNADADQFEGKQAGVLPRRAEFAGTDRVWELDCKDKMAILGPGGKAKGPFAIDAPLSHNSFSLFSTPPLRPAKRCEEVDTDKQIARPVLHGDIHPKGTADGPGEVLFTSPQTANHIVLRVEPFRCHPDVKGLIAHFLHLVRLRENNHASNQADSRQNRNGPWPPMAAGHAAKRFVMALSTAQGYSAKRQRAENRKRHWQEDDIPVGIGERRRHHDDIPQQAEAMAKAVLTARFGDSE